MISREDVDEATDALSEIAVTKKSVSNDRRTALINLKISETTDEELTSSITVNGVKLKPNKSSSSLNSSKKSSGNQTSSKKIVKKRRAGRNLHAYPESNCSSNSLKSGETGISGIEDSGLENGNEKKEEKTPTYDQVFQANTYSNLVINSDLVNVIQSSSPPSANFVGSQRRSSITYPIKPRVKNYEYEFGEKLAIGNNAKIKMMIELFDHSSDEQIEGCFICFKGDLIGVHHRPPIVYLVITNNCLYFLNPIHEHHEIFNLDHSVKLSQIKCLETEMTGLGLVVVHEKNCGRTFYRIMTCTGIVLNSIIDLLHKTCNRSGLAPPEIVRKELSKQMMLKCFLSTYSSLDLEDIILIHVSCVFWFKSQQPEGLVSTFDDLNSLSSSYENCTGFKEGVLMYQIMDGELDKTPNLKSGIWKAGYFLLKHGYVYCYENSHKSRLIFFCQLYNNRCKGCKRVVAEDENYSIFRPNVIEVKYIGCDHKLHYLFLAVPSESETTDWMMNMLNEIDLNLSDLLGTFDFYNNNNSWEKLVSLILTENSIYVLVNNQNQSSLKIDSSLEATHPVIASLFKSSLPFSVLGCINISDVISVYVDDSNYQRSASFTFIIIEYENTATTGQCNFKWKLFFVNSNERNLFLDKLSRCWSQLFQAQLQIVQIDDTTGAEPGLDDGDEDVDECKQGLERISCWYRDLVLNVRDEK